MTDDIDAPLNRKDITEEITGAGIIDFDSDMDDEADQPIDADPEELNQIVGILDMLITSTPPMLENRGYPAPNLDIWESWGKPNLSKAFNAYLPAGAGNALSSPAFCGLLGLGALVFAFLPVILHFLDKKDAEKVKIEEPTKPTDSGPQKRGMYEDTYEEPIGVSREPTKSTAAISSGPNKAAWDRVHEVIDSQK
jgi:hypothetical protein